jgi:hypothetical protein
VPNAETSNLISSNQAALGRHPSHNVAGNHDYILKESTYWFEIFDDHTVMLCGEIKVKVGGRMVKSCIPCVRRPSGFVTILVIFHQSAMPRKSSGKGSRVLVSTLSTST